MNGELTTITIESTRLSGEKKISLTNLNISMSFKIYISSGIITAVYGAAYTVSGIEVTGTLLTKDSDYQATYRVYCISGFSTVTRWLRANISTGNIVVTYG